MPSGTPSGLVRIPLTGPLLPPPPHLLTLYYLGEKLSGGKLIINERQRTAGGGIIIRRRARVGQKSDKKSHSAENCRTVPKTPYSIS